MPIFDNVFLALVLKLAAIAVTKIDSQNQAE